MATVMDKQLPSKITSLEEPLNDEVKQMFSAYTSGLVKVGDSDYIMPTQYTRFATKYYNYK